jgi:hypothetical protein
MADPRNSLGLPNANTGEYVTAARVKDWTGVVARRALSLDGNEGGATEYLFPNPEQQLEHISTTAVEPPY